MDESRRRKREGSFVRSSIARSRKTLRDEFDSLRAGEEESFRIGTSCPGLLRAKNHGLEKKRKKERKRRRSVSLKSRKKRDAIYFEDLLTCCDPKFL